MALDGEGDLPAPSARALRERDPGGAGRPAQPRSSARSAAPRAPTGTTFVAEVERLARVHPDLGVVLEAGDEGDVPPALEPLAQSVLAEAVRNAHKHAQPNARERPGRPRRRRVRARGGQRRRHGDARRRAGMGLRLAALEALQSGGVVEFGEREPGTWQVRLVVPVTMSPTGG